MSYDVKYIGMDVHKEAIVIAVLNEGGKLVMESVIETKASSILQRLLADYPTPHTPAAVTSSPTEPTCFRCPKCSTPMLIVERFSVTTAWQLSPRSALLDSS